MKRVAACYKWVWDDADIRTDERTRELSFEKARRKISEYDRNAIEAGVQVKGATGCELIGVTCGAGLKASLKDALSRGLDSVVYLDDSSLQNADSQVTAKILAALIRAAGEADLVICGEGSSDEYAQQTDARLAALLGYASVSCVNRIEVCGERLRLRRKLEGEVEVVETTGPVVVSVLPDANDPPIPGLKQILGAGKKPSTVRTFAELGLAADCLQTPLATVSVLAPETNRRNIRIDQAGDSMPEAARKLVQRLVADGIIH